MTNKVHIDKAGQKISDPVVQGILDSDSRTIREIYKQQFNKIRSMVRNFHKLNIDPEDVFQEGLTRAIINVRNGRFNGKSAFSTYLYSICHNICLKEYRKNKYQFSNELKDVEEELPLDNFDILQVIVKEKDKLDLNCRQVIDLRFGMVEESTGTGFESIAAELDIKPDNARQRFGRCFAKLMEMLRRNKEFNLLSQ
jgi:RNA polymerase sigma factor (sigma-70 family)